MAPERRVPAAASGLQASVETDSIVVSWNNPKTRADNTPLKDLTTVRLYRREDAAGAPLKPAMLSWGQIVGYQEIASIRMETPAPAAVEGEAVRWVDRRGLTFGRRYVYTVLAMDSRGHSSAPSQRLPIIFLAAPRPPRNLAADAGDRRVRLRWDPPTEQIDGSAVSGEVRYLVLRGAGTEAPLVPVTPTPVTGTSFTDTGLENDTTYRYAVRAVRIEPSGTARGEAATRVTATPADTTPPRPPTDLVAIPSPTAVRLAWNRSPDDDVASYVVYRAAGAGSLALVGTTPALNTVFVDRNVQTGATYRYAVTALDSARDANESARSNEVSVTIP